MRFIIAIALFFISLSSQAVVTNGKLIPSASFDSNRNRFLATYKTIVSSSCVSIDGVLLDYNGAVLGSSFNITTTCGSGDSNILSAYDPQHDVYLVVWKKDSGVDVYGAMVSGQGVVTAVAFPVISDMASQQIDPVVAYMPSLGKFIVVASDQRSGKYNIVAQIVNSDGTMQGALFTISSDGIDKLYPAIAYDSVNDNFLVAWADTRNGASLDIYGRFVSGTGAVLGTQDISLVNTTPALYYPNIAFDSINKRYMIAAIDANSDVEGIILTDSGAAAGISFIIASDATASFASPRLTFDTANNRYMVLWNDLTNYDIDAQFVDINGSLSGSSFAVKEDDSNINRYFNPFLVYNSFMRNTLLVDSDVNASVYELDFGTVGTPDPVSYLAYPMDKTAGVVPSSGSLDTTFGFYVNFWGAVKPASVSLIITRTTTTLSTGSISSMNNILFLTIFGLAVLAVLIIRKSKAYLFVVFAFVCMFFVNSCDGGSDDSAGSTVSASDVNNTETISAAETDTADTDTLDGKGYSVAKKFAAYGTYTFKFVAVDGSGNSIESVTKTLTVN